MCARKAVFATLAVALVCGLSSAAVHADEAFVCDDGSVVNVKPGELEVIKRTNPCVAKYFGLTVDEPRKVVALRTDHAVPLPGRKPGPPNIALKRIEKEPVPRADRNQVSMATEPAATAEATPAEPSTYRRVRIINAKPGGTEWFNHTQ